MNLFLKRPFATRNHTLGRPSHATEGYCRCTVKLLDIYLHVKGDPTAYNLFRLSNANHVRK